jgi:hypothetical protein
MGWRLTSSHSALFLSSRVSPDVAAINENYRIEQETLMRRVRVKDPSMRVIYDPSVEYITNMIFEEAFWAEGNVSTMTFEDTTIERNLVLTHVAEYGIYLKYYEHLFDTKFEWLSLADENALIDTIDCGDEWYCSMGLIYPAKEVLPAVFDYCLMGERSNKVRWIKSSEMPENSNW